MSIENPRRSSDRPAVTAAAVKGIGGRSSQEDTYIIQKHPDDEALLVMVADGMGGMQGGRRASRTAVSVVKNIFMKADMNGDITAMLKDAVSKANDTLYTMFKLSGGSTGIICVFRRGKMYYAGMGDSFLMLRRGDYLYHLNLRQNLYYDLCMRRIQLGSTDRSVALSHPERHALTGYLGMKKLGDIDCFERPMPLYRNDSVLICSDGVGDVLSDGELKECLSSASSDEACRRLDEKIYAADSTYQDNYTAVVVKYR